MNDDVLAEWVEDIELRLDQLEVWKEQHVKKESAMEQQIAQLDNDLNAQQAALTALQDRANSAQNMIAQLQAQIAQLQSSPAGANLSKEIVQLEAITQSINGVLSGQSTGQPTIPPTNPVAAPEPGTPVATQPTPPA